MIYEKVIEQKFVLLNTAYHMIIFKSCLALRIIHDCWWLSPIDKLLFRVEQEVRYQCKCIFRFLVIRSTWSDHGLCWSCKSERISQFQTSVLYLFRHWVAIGWRFVCSTRRNVTHVNEFRRWPISVEDCPIHRETSNSSVYFRNLLFENDRTV